MLQLNFKPESEQFKLATEEYINIWNSDGQKILETFKVITKLDFKQKAIDVVVYEGPSFSGKRDSPMKLRASYDVDNKKGALVHELGHRLIAPMHNRVEGLDEHQHLNLFLYNVWVQMYGSGFAEKIVTVEKNRRGLYDYENAWNWFFELSNEEKEELWNKFVSLN